MGNYNEDEDYYNDDYEEEIDEEFEENYEQYQNIDIYEQQFNIEQNNLFYSGDYEITNKLAEYIDKYEYGFDFRQQLEILRTLRAGIELNEDIYNPNVSFEDMKNYRNYIIKQKNEEFDINTVSDNDEYWTKRANILLLDYGLMKQNVFLQSSNINYYAMPQQGWKLHLSASSKKDYCELLETVIPDFIQNNVNFKIVQPDSFAVDNTFANIFGKEITIYPDKNFDISKLKKETVEKMLEPCDRHPDTDKNFQGRINGRFGRFKDASLPIQDGKGGCVYDERTPGLFAPVFIGDTNVKEILNRQQILENRLKETGDYRMYIQEYLLGIIFDTSSEYQFSQYCFKNENDAKKVAEYLSGANVSADIVNIFGQNFCVVSNDNTHSLESAVKRVRLNDEFFKLSDKPNYLDTLKEQLKENIEPLKEEIR